MNLCTATPTLVPEQNRRSAMHVLVVNLHLKDMTDAGVRSMANEVAPAFASVPGLQVTWPQTWVKARGQPNCANLTSREDDITLNDGTKQQSSSVPVALQQISQ